MNLLREYVDEAGLTLLQAEIAPLEGMTVDRGVGAAVADRGLEQLRGLLAACPLLGELLGRILVWYDYSCLPQHPRDADDEAFFREGLRQQELLQLLGRTAILLDEADDYLTRAWCTLEALVALGVIRNPDVLVGSDRPTARSGVTEHYLEKLLNWRPHVVWRAVLDTEVFGVQTPTECLSRLELAATRDDDLPFIYSQLRRLRAPEDLHSDSSDLLTGALPVPLVDRGRAVLLPGRGGRQPDAEPSPQPTRTLDWTDVLQLEHAWPPAATTDAPVPSTVELSERTGPPQHSAPSGHLAVVASCEGEALVTARWVLARSPELEVMLGVHLVSMTWLASDPAPVGHFVDGQLRPVPVDADCWILVSTDLRFRYCPLLRGLIEAARDASRSVVLLRINDARDNVETLGAPAGRGDSVEVGLRRGGLPMFPGGLFRDHLHAALTATTGTGAG